jgi:hypothetical protein
MRIDGHCSTCPFRIKLTRTYRGARSVSAVRIALPRVRPNWDAPRGQQNVSAAVMYVTVTFELSDCGKHFSHQTPLRHS